jgi:hypothetical protein
MVVCIKACMSAVEIISSSLFRIGERGWPKASPFYHLITYMSGHQKGNPIMFIVTDSETDKTELALYDSQYQWIEQHHGKEAADFANYGWVVESNDSSPFLGVATKVYGIGILYSDVLNLIEDGGELQVTHEFGGL